MEKNKENNKIKPGAKEKIIKIFEKLADRHIDLIIRFVEKNRRNSFSEKARELLTESLEFIRPK